MAPRLIAVTASVDAAEAGDHDREDLGIAGERRVEDVHAVGVGQPQVDDQGVVGERLEALDGVGGVGAPGRPRSRRRSSDSAMSWRRSASSSTTRTVGWAVDWS